MRQISSLAAVRVFKAAARHLNFTLAARELGMTQAAVSYQISVLEQRMGMPLFLRQKGRVTLSDAGRRVAPLISGAFDTLDDAFAVLRAEAAGGFGDQLPDDLRVELARPAPRRISAGTSRTRGSAPRGEYARRFRP